MGPWFFKIVISPYHLLNQLGPVFYYKRQDILTFSLPVEFIRSGALYDCLNKKDYNLG
jgi:hypothetical protein